MYNEIIHLGLLGEKLGHSLSPQIHEYLFKQQNISGTYKLYEVPKDEITEVFQMMDDNHLTGLNVTIPYKESICKMVDELDEHAARIGAVNTVLRMNGRSYGYNTDFIGMISMFLKANISLKDASVVILGSGGACKALIYGCHLEGASSITIAARNEAAKQNLQEHFPYISTCTLSDIPSGDILLNATPVGMWPNTGKSVVGPEVIRRFQIAADIVYNPLITEFLRIAKEEGLTIVTGLTMLVDQAIGSEEIWLGKKLDYHMGDAINEELAKQFKQNA